MSDDEATATNESRPAVGAPVEPSVRPRYWMTREAVQRLRAELRSVTDHLHELLNFGFPPKGRSKDDRESHDAWHEDRHAAVRRAYEALEQTAVFSDTQSD